MLSKTDKDSEIQKPPEVDVYQDFNSNQTASRSGVNSKLSKRNKSINSHRNLNSNLDIFQNSSRKLKTLR